MNHDDYNRLLKSLRLGTRMGTDAAREVFEYVLEHHPKQARSIALKVVSIVAFEEAEFPARWDPTDEAPSERLAYTVDEAAQLVGVGVTAMRRQLLAGNLGAVKIGDRGTRIPRVELIRWMNSLPIWETSGPIAPVTPNSPRIHPRRPGEDAL
jgi:excisionase family DNA binding protein